MSHLTASLPAQHEKPVSASAALPGSQKPPASVSAPSAPLSSSAGPQSSSSIPSRNVLTRHKVGRLLDIIVNEQFKEVVLYASEVVPEFFPSEDQRSRSRAAEDEGRAVVGNTESTPKQQSQQLGGPGRATAVAAAGRNSPSPTTKTSSLPSGVVGVTTAAAGASADALCGALDSRAIEMHKGFLKEFAAVYDTFNEVAACVQQLEGRCSVLTRSLGEHATEAEEFMRHVGTLQSEIHLIEQRNREIRGFKEKLNFGAEEQRVLEEAHVDDHYLSVLERAREVHHRSRTLLLSREFQQSAGAVMESTYSAIMKATERIARYLLSLITATSTTADGRCYDTMMAGMTADVPRVSPFYLRCVQVLWEENQPQWEKVVEEVARLRRASVLRRYFHLLTTGSATTASGTYHASVGGGGGASASSAARGPSDGEEANGGRSSTRPLEAELNNPVLFFSALFAWLHQTIVEEDDFLEHFFLGHAQTAGGDAHTPSTLASLTGTAQVAPTSTTTKASLLNYTFGGVCKHVQSALTTVLERFVRITAALGAAETQDGANSGKGPRGLTGGLTRLISAATGRPMHLGAAGAPTSAGGGGRGLSAIERYSAVTTRTQQQALVSKSMQGTLHGTLTTFTLLQLFRYYGSATFAPLLGPTSQLTVLVTDTAAVELLKVFHQYVALLSSRLFDSPAGVVSRLAVLRRLSSAFSMEFASGDAAPTTTTRDTDGPAQPPARCFVMNFLLTHGGAVAAGGGSEEGSSPAAELTSSTSMSISDPVTFYSGNADTELRASAGELMRALQHLVLPPSPEMEECLQVLTTVLADGERQLAALTALAENRKQRQEQEAGDGKGPEADAGEASWSSDSFGTALIRALWAAPAQLAKQVTLSNGLDDPSLRVMEHNTTYALLQVLRDREEFVTELIAHDTGGVGAADSRPQRLSPLPTCDMATERLSGLRTAIAHCVAEATTRHYFSAFNSGPANAEQAEQRVRAVLPQLHNFYNLCAASGRIPPLPVVSSLADPVERVWQQRAATLHLCEVYSQLHAEVERLCATGVALGTEEVESIADMAPSKLQVLMSND